MLQKKVSLLDVFLVYLVIFQLPLHTEIGNCVKEVLSHRTFGEYFFDWKYMGQCENVGTNELQMNIKLTKKNKKPQVFGNHTFFIPWDETISMNLQFMKLGSQSAWVQNFFQWKLTGCSQYRALFSGSEFLKHMNLPNACPVSKGVYVIREFDVDKLVASSPLVPKTFFYGSYRIICNLKKDEKVVGCATVAVDMLPLWQRRNRTT